MNNKIKLTKIGLDILTLVTKVSFGIGFLCVTTYFFNIGYFPIKSSYSIILYLILTSAFASIFLLATIFGCFVFAPLTWIKLLSMPDVFLWWNKKNLSVLDSYNAGKFNLDFKTKLYILIRYIAYTSLYLLIFLSVLTYVKSKSILMFITICLIILAVIGILWYENDIKKDKHKLRFTLKEKTVIFLKILCITSASGFYLFWSIALIMLLLTKNPSFHEVMQHWSYPLYISFMIVFSSGICLFSPKGESISHKAWIFSVGILSVVICFIYNLNFISSTLLSKLKLTYSNATLQIDNVACQALQKADYPIQCSSKKQKYFVHNVNVKWRSGEYYIVFRAGNETHGVTIPSAHILTADSIIKDNRME